MLLYTAALPRIYRRELHTVTLYSINLAELMNLQAEVIWHIYQLTGFCGQRHILSRYTQRRDRDSVTPHVQV